MSGLLGLSRSGIRYGGAALLGFGGLCASAYCAERESFVAPDPEAWERVAKALKEINKSPNAKAVYEYMKQEEITKQTENKAKEAESLAAAKQYEVQTEQVRWEEQRKTLQMQQQQQAELAKAQDDMARKRQELEHQRNRERNAELVQMQEESRKRQEAERLKIEQQIQAERRATEQYRAEREKEVQRVRELAAAEGRTKERRENEDVNRRELILKYEEWTKASTQLINTTFSNLGSGFSALLTQSDKAIAFLVISTTLFAGYFGVREGMRVGAKAAERWLVTPRLVRDTSRQTLGSLYDVFLPWRWSLLKATTKSMEQVSKDFKDIVLNTELHDRVRSLAAVAANTKRHNAPFRHLLFYGPPGTGKTMVAKRLAYTSGLDYAILTGGDVAPLESAAVPQLHNTFDWATTSSKGLILFIDEADAFLARRRSDMSEGLRGALNAVLYRTGDQSRDFMLVLATNRPEDLDVAVLDRMDEVIEFPLPTVEGRHKLLQVYFDKYITKSEFEDEGRGRSFLGIGRSQKLSVQGVGDEQLWEAARKTDGFSARELAKLMASVQASVYGSHELVLTPDIFYNVLTHKIEEHAQRKQFSNVLEV
eukprot:TRINITY_DN1551_c0_g1_i6.p1 TRINITY_DN1551_c0_g1~~TRINITY_DN1551_c0_g1_i6.p1  ORF type:complete len:596 (-),score=82.61 TRINITY_DN1551_c0_g1_i6:458-2245(-)